MRVCVVGAGVIGLTSAYALAKRGYEVTVVDACESVGQGTSFANGAQLSYAYVAPLADPSVWRNLPGYLLRPSSPLTWKPKLELRQWMWLLRFLAACNATASHRTTAVLLRLASLSRESLHDMQAEHVLDFQHKKAGKLVMLSSDAALASARRQIRIQAELGGDAQQLLTPDQCIAIEPALALAMKRWVGGVYTPSEEVGDCARFCQQLGTLLERQYGVRFMFGTKVSNAVHVAGAIKALKTSNDDLVADLFVFANGAGSVKLARQLGLRIPVYPIKGYSITLKSDCMRPALPHVSITDSAKKIVYARIGDQLRVAGRAEIVGEDLRLDMARCKELAMEAESLFYPRGLPDAHIAPWAGLRPATPTGVPVIGKTPFSNLYLNCGHGALGWTLACGSAEILAVDMTREKRPFSGLPHGLAS